MRQDYIFTMMDLRKTTAGGKEVLRGINLSFFPKAKIGVIGPNGAGKSTLLRIMAGVDTEFQGHAQPDPGARVGFLAQEPALDASLDVRGNVELGLKSIRSLLDRFNEVSAKFAEPMGDDEMNKLMEEQGNLQDAIDA
jgi:energy-dependent translational throttle protein EttA